MSAPPPRRPPALQRAPPAALVPCTGPRAVAPRCRPGACTAPARPAQTRRRGHATRAAPAHRSSTCRPPRALARAARAAAPTTGR
eukprot:356301-Chlamydomonas_euryale.AAC.2